VHAVAVARDAEIFPIGGEEVVDVFVACLGDVSLQFVPAETTAAAPLHQLELRRPVELGVDRVEQVGEPVRGELVVRLRALQRLVDRRDDGGFERGVNRGRPEQHQRAGAAGPLRGALKEFGTVHG